MKRKQRMTMGKTLLTILFVTIACNVVAQRVNYVENVKAGTIDQISIESDEDKMEWLLKTDGTQYPWVTDRYQWGLGYLTEDDKVYEWIPEGENKYKAGSITIGVQRSYDGDDLVETYIFTNTSRKKVRLSDMGIYTPFNDNYPNAKICMENRCNVHIWHGGKAAYVNALRMNGTPPHLGLMVTEGKIADYDVWERGQKKAMSNFRGVFALCPPDMMLGAGKSFRLQWRLFVHNGGDFEEQLLKRGGMIARSEKYVYEIGETAEVDFITKDKKKTVKKKIQEPGDIRVDYQGTYALLSGVSSEKKLLKKRIRFILEHQQMNDKNDARYGSFMVYDNEGDSILTNDYGRSDLDEGRERVGMGVLLAEYCRLYPDAGIQDALVRYADFLRRKLQKEDYTTYSKVSVLSKNRGYNYAWVADFYFRMYLLTGNVQYARDGYGTMRALYRMFGYGFYCIGYPVTIALKALEQAGLTTERNFLLYDFKQTADIFARNGLNFPTSEVNYEQAIIGPAVQLLCEVFLATQEKKYLDAAQKMMPALDAFNGHQPNHHLNDIAIRHWDGYWFGKRRVYGDVYPHYWSTITADVFHYYAQATGLMEYQRRAENIVRGNLSLFFEDGKATCAFVYPRRVNGESAHFADAYANDQDWALVSYLLVNAVE